ncbi:glycosyltransferase [Candidatus Gottesmanbacteria bacterium]|nr:glycosyltransferase [Candidatus Gottesmanbacteria bacterium]
MTRTAISVVAPAYNDAQTITPILTSLERSLQRAKRKYEIVILDDESHDATVDILTAWPKSSHLRGKDISGAQWVSETFYCCTV